MPKISVLMPIYNVEPAFLNGAIQSILNQSYPDFEFLILNDSPENKQIDKIVSSYQDKRIQYFKSKKNLGVADAHNFLLKHASGEYVALMDHDDISLPKRFEKQLAFLEQHPDVGLCGVACYRFGQLLKTGSIYFPTDPEDIQAALLFKCPILHPSIMFRRSILTKNNIKWDNQFISLNDRKLYFDLSFFTKLANLPKVLYCYRISPKMTSRVKHRQINAEQAVFRNIYFKRMGVHLSSKEIETLNHYIMKGRCHIQSRAVLEQINRLLIRLVKLNQKKHFAPDDAFQKICARYLVKRCKNAAFYGRVPCSDILRKTSLPVQIPFLLKIYTKLDWLLRFNK